MSKLVYHFTYLLAGLTWGRNFYPISTPYLYPRGSSTHGKPAYWRKLHCKAHYSVPILLVLTQSASWLDSWNVQLRNKSNTTWNVKKRVTRKRCKKLVGYGREGESVNIACHLKTSTSEFVDNRSQCVRDVYISIRSLLNFLFSSSNHALSSWAVHSDRTELNRTLVGGFHCEKQHWNACVEN